MIIPIRCFSCGKPVGHLWESFKERAEKGEEKKKVMDELGLAHDYLISHEETRIPEKLKDKTQRLRQNAPQIRQQIQASIPTYLSRMAENERHFARLVQQNFI